MRATEIFTPGKPPTVTFIDDHLEDRRETLLNTLEAGGFVVSLSGPSKSGKTVFVEKVLGKEALISVTGAGVDSPARLWERVFDIIGTPISKKVTDQNGWQGVMNGKAGLAVGVGLKASAEIGGSATASEMLSEQVEYAVDHLQLLISELSGTDFVLFIDDFHYIPSEIQVEISNQIKDAAQKGVKIICASVPYHSDDAIRANKDLRGRVVKIDFDYWGGEELKKIARLGFDELNLEVSDAYVSALTDEAAGSPQLMQALCLNTCFQSSIKESLQERKALAISEELVSRVCGATAYMTDYSSTLEKLKDGPKTRGTERKSYLLKDGAIVDVYPLVLKAIALNPPELTIRYQNLQGRVATLCAGENPSGSSVTGACAHIASIANDSENKNVVEWDSGNDVFDIRDSYFLFFLRWGN